MECAEAAAAAEKKTTDVAAADAVEKNPNDPAPALEKTKGAAVEKKKTREKKDKKETAKNTNNTNAQFRPPRPGQALGRAPADDADEAGEEAGEDAGD